MYFKIKQNKTTYIALFGKQISLSLSTITELKNKNAADSPKRVEAIFI